MGDFLDESTGNTIATHISGMGLIPETISHEVDDFLNQREPEWIKQHLRLELTEEENDELTDIVADEHIIRILWLERLIKEPFEPFVEPHLLQAASILEHKRHDDNARRAREKAQYETEQHNIQVALAWLETNGYPSTDYYPQQRKDEAKALLDTIAQEFGYATVHALLKHTTTLRFSNKLRLNLAQYYKNAHLN